MEGLDRAAMAAPWPRAAAVLEPEGPRAGAGAGAAGPVEKAAEA
ncbi:MAG TPA: hypothetical protein PK156_33400 [Polyangium sp.]|nr:hypothetical protein [Polyangium sp.]